MKNIRITGIAHLARVMIVLTLILAFQPRHAIAAGTCGTGSWAPGALEIHHINIGQGDSALIVSPTGKSLLFDAGESKLFARVGCMTSSILFRAAF